MIWFFISVILFGAGFLLGKKCLERTPEVKNSLAAIVCVLCALTCLMPAILEWRLHYDTPLQFLLICPFLFGTIFGAVWASDEAKAALIARADEKRQKRIASQQYSYCPVCGTPLIPKQGGEPEALSCSSCPWVKDGSAK